MTDRSILDGIRVASPCPANWHEMVGNDRTRFCAGCKKDVHDISALTTVEAMALLNQGGEAPCVQFYRRADGTVMTADCPVRARTIRHRLIRRVAGVGVIGVAMAWSATAVAVSRAALAGRCDDREGQSMPTWSGSTFNDWVDWSLVSLGLRKPKVNIRGGAIWFLNPVSTSANPYDPDRAEPGFDCESDL